MTDNGQPWKKIVRIKTLEHASGGLFVAVSDDLPGLSIAGLSTDEIENKIPAAVREFLELSGYQVLSIEISRDARVARAQFGLPGFIAHASLMANHAA
jgi:hypothetical protein